MEARILDTRDGTTATLFVDLPHPKYALELNTMATPDRFGHVRAQAIADADNKREAGERFKVVRVVPPVGSIVRFHAFGAYRGGRVVDNKIGRLHVSVQVAWHNNKGENHLRWYTTLNLHNAGTSPDVFSHEVA